MSWITWISTLPYLQLYWIGQTVIYVLLLAYALVTGQSSGRIRRRRDPDAKLGWLEFRKRYDQCVRYNIITIKLKNYSRICSVADPWGRRGGRAMRTK